MYFDFLLNFLPQARSKQRGPRGANAQAGKGEGGTLPETLNKFFGAVNVRSPSKIQH